MIKNLENKKKKKAFTLIELIIVIAIIAILAAIALPKFGEIRKNANIKADIATAKNIHSAVTAILTENGTLPENPINTAIGTIPKSKLNNVDFKVKLDNGNIIVYVSSDETLDTFEQVYPEPSTKTNNIWYGGTLPATPTPSGNGG